MSKLGEFDRSEQERLRRVHETHAADRPTERELSTLFQRWQFGQRGHSRLGRLRPIALAFALSAFAGGALALSGALGYSAGSRPSAPPAVSERKAARSFVVERGGRHQHHSQAVSLDLLPGERVTVVVNDARTELMGPGLARVQASTSNSSWVASFEPKGFAPRFGVELGGPSANAASASPAPAVEPRATQHRPAAASAASSAGAPTNAWERAAEALRRGDEVAATAALTELSGDSDPATRDAALLAAAQLELAAGRRERALPSLQALVRGGATPFVRGRAAEILNAQE